MQTECKPTFESFAKKVRAAFPGIDIEFVKTTGELKKAIADCRGSHARVSLHIFPNSAHQLAVSTSKTSVVFLASFDDDTPADQPSSDSISPTLSMIGAELERQPIYMIGSLPPRNPPCPSPPQCDLTAVLVIGNALGKSPPKL